MEEDKKIKSEWDNDIIYLINERLNHGININNISIINDKIKKFNSNECNKSFNSKLKKSDEQEEEEEEEEDEFAAKCSEDSYIYIDMELRD